MKKINLTDYIRKAGETVQLTDGERARMKHTLSEYMSVKPIRESLVGRRQPIATAWLQVYAFSRKSVAWALLLAILFSGAGVSYAAEGTVPGDILYPLKVGVSEPIQGALSVSEESKVSWNATLAERRLEEAEKLASENRLTDDKRTQLIARFDTHAQAATDGIQSLEDSGSSSAIGIASDFEATLSAHVSVLGDFNGRGKTDVVESRVREKTLALSKVREKAEENAQISAPASHPVAVATTFALAAPAPSADARVALKAESSGQDTQLNTGVRKEVVQKMGVTAKTSMQNARKLFARVQSKLNQETVTNVSARFSEEEKLIQNGDALFASGDFASAFRAYQEASVGAEKFSVYLKAFLKLKINTLPANSQAKVLPVQVQTGSTEMETSHESSEIKIPTPLPLPIQILAPQSDNHSDETESGEATHEGANQKEELDVKDSIEGQLKTRLGL